ncbi:uncharacterized protein LOC9657017 isoform X1 [Selaginella moellendorffii]|uniref:uncharacterized protein LOC9657017 isoform X1 n=1 Tax=Selaginella moellendorffii TaxID=88036 RepID=UPI000D1C35D8|nr:uncharacterized protein LOC9657017 isoform X1 [Selaginella moellendorffii]|eukprot:XP_024541608.1 uncharacterized protein LOC9657017 isoform X1 [Selaginella moellendorffii]
MLLASPISARSATSDLIHAKRSFQHQWRPRQSASIQNGSRRISRIAAAASHSIVVASDPHLDAWKTWSVLLASGAFGLWSERNTKWGSALSGALVSTLFALFSSNLGILATESSVYGTVNAFLLPLAIPLLLFSADMKRVLTSTGRLLLVFLLGSVATIIGTLVAMKLVPLTGLGTDGWKIAAALMSRHIGGAVNYVAVSEALGASPSVVASGLAADNLICAVYFTTLFALASSIPAEEKTGLENSSSLCSLTFFLILAESSSAATSPESKNEKAEIKVLEASFALAISAGVCSAGVWCSNIIGYRSGSMAVITALAVILATMFPSRLGPLVSTGQGLALLLMQVFFATVGASGSIRSVLATAPSLFLFCVVQIGVHLLIVLGVGKLLGVEKRLLLLASNANVGGPTTAAGMATAKGWTSLIVPGILAGIFGISIATFLSIALGITLLQKL